jgi:RNA polymerase sigma-70 factor (ECF subfamily)
MHFRKRSVKLEKTTEEGETPVQIVRGTENPNAMPVMDRIALDNALKQLPPGYRTVFRAARHRRSTSTKRSRRCSAWPSAPSKSQLHKAR